MTDSLAMQLTHVPARPNHNPTSVPHLQATSAYLIGPGKLGSEQGNLVFRSPPRRERSERPTKPSGTTNRPVSRDTEYRQLVLKLEGLELVLAFGDVSLSARALELLAQHDVSFALASANGQTLHALLVPHATRRPLARLMQYRTFEQPACRLATALSFVREKLVSVGHALRHYQRQGHARPLVPALLADLPEIEARITKATSLDQLRGCEGQLAVRWFQVFAQLLAPPWTFPGRVKRPPTDPVNALLSLGYTLALHRITARLRANSLEPALGALHAYRPGRPSLACDVLEPFRVPTVDRWVVGLCNQQHVSPADFVSTSSQGTRLTEAAFPRVLVSWQKHWLDGRWDQHLDFAVHNLVTQLSLQAGDFAPPDDPHAELEP